MLNKGPNVPPALASGIICLVIGGAIGVNFRDEHTRTTDKSPGISLSAMSKGGGGGAGAGGQQASASRDLTGLVRNLATVQKVQNKGLTAEQSAKLMPILTSIQSADKLPDADCAAKLTEIKAILTPDQTQMLADMTPQRPAGGAGGGMGKMGGAPGGGMMGGGGMGKGAQPDPDKPFASERNKKALTDLMSALGSVK